MALITDFPLFLASVVLISMSGVLMPGPLFAVTIDKSSRHKTAGALIALGHGVVEFPLMFLIFFLLTEFSVPWYVQAAVGVVGGLLMIWMASKSTKPATNPTKHTPHQTKIPCWQASAQPPPTQALSSGG